MNDQRECLKLIQELIDKQSIILGPDIGLVQARKISGINIDTNGKVLSFSGDCKDILKKLIDGYVGLSGQIVKTTLSSDITKISED